MGLGGRLGWYLRRLRVMGPRELVHRLGEQLTLLRLRRAAGRARGWDGPPSAPGPGGPLPELDWCFDPDSPEADQLLAGRWPALGVPWQFTGEPGQWHVAPDTGRRWPEIFFGAIDYRAGNPCGDARIAWEPARLQWLVGLGLICRRGAPGRGAQAARLLVSGLEDFMAGNPPLRGIHYVSAMECALRLIAVCHALDLGRDCLADAPRAWARAAALAGQHARLIEQRLSLHSSAGNHTIAEAAGLVYAGVVFPGLPGAARWQARGLALLRQEAPRQVLEDGGGLEQAFGYLVFVADLCGLVLALLARRGLPAPPELAAAFGRAREFIATLVGTLGAVPPVGDGDGGHALGPWLRMALPLAAPAPAGDRTWATAGYSVLVARGEEGSAVLLDHGSLGMPPSFGHGHADALALLYRYRGRQLLIDPGTYTYTGDPGWRRYFRSTAAHNTVTVDRQDQAVQRSAFMWSDPYRCQLVRLERRGQVVLALARHEAYVRASGPVHWRGVALHDSGALLVWDQLEGAGRHQAELHWHLGAEAVPQEAGWLIGNLAFLEVQGAQTVTLHAGERDPAAGWQSPVYGRLQQGQVIRASHVGNLPCEFLTRIRPQGTAPPLDQWREHLAILRRWRA